MKIRPVGVEMFCEDGRTDRRTEMTKLIVAFSQFFERSLKKFQYDGKRKKLFWKSVNYYSDTPNQIKGEKFC